MDWIIVVFTLLLALAGARQGFVVGALSLAGFALGAVIGTRIGPLVLPNGAHSPYAPLFGLMGALLAGSLIATGLGGVGGRVRSMIRLPGFGAADGLLGGALSACVALGIAWIAGAAALQLPGQQQLRRDVQRSAILRRLNDLLPPSGPILNALGRLDPLPAINGPTALVPPPQPAIARVAGVRRATLSTVKVLGTACGLGVEGSGWIVRPGVVVTNAHVVAGETDTTVRLQGTGPQLDAHAIAFDPHDDVAILRVPGLDAQPLTMAPGATTGANAAVIGYPENGPLTVRAARLGNVSSVLSQDAYGRGPVQREILSLRALVRPGNSGGPVVDTAGRVVGTVFAATVGGPHHGGLAIPDAIVRRALASAGGSVGTGPCTR